MQSSKERSNEPTLSLDDKRRKPYEPPRITDEAEFEGLALKCTQVGFACGGGASGTS